MSQLVYISNDNLLLLEGLYDNSPAVLDYVNDATVVCTLVDEDGDEVSGQSWPLTLSYVTDSNGDYAGVLDDGLSLSNWDELTAQITATGNSLTGYWEFPLVARTRER